MQPVRREQRGRRHGGQVRIAQKRRSSKTAQEERERRFEEDHRSPSGRRTLPY